MVDAAEQIAGLEEGMEKVIVQGEDHSLAVQLSEAGDDWSRKNSYVQVYAEDPPDYVNVMLNREQLGSLITVLQYYKFVIDMREGGGVT